MIFILLMYAVMALSFPFGKMAIGMAMAPAFVIAFRMIPTGLGCIFLHFKQRKTVGKFVWRDAFLFVLVGLFGVYLHLVPEYWSLKYLDSVKVILIYSFSPFITALLSYFLINERLNRKQRLGLVTGLFGMIPVLLASTPGEIGLRSVLFISLPELAMIFATFAIDLSWFGVKKLAGRGYSLLLINGISMFVGGLFSLVHFFIFHGFHLFPVVAPFKFIAISLFLVVAANMTTYNMYAELLKKYSVTFLSFAGFVLPIFGAIYGKLFFDEKVSWLYLVALVFIAIGLFLYYMGSRKKERRGLL